MNSFNEVLQWNFCDFGSPLGSLWMNGPWLRKIPHYTNRLPLKIGQDPKRKVYLPTIFQVQTVCFWVTGTLALFGVGC